jgi:colanic acid/amylovoran biosynthesis glycosyltransferase
LSEVNYNCILKYRTIILFTSAFPYGDGEQFIETELGFLSKEFEKIYIFPYYYGGNQKAREGLPSNCITFEPFRNKKHTFVKLLFKGIFNTRTLLPYLNELFRKPSLLVQPVNLFAWFRNMLHCRMILNDKRLLRCIASDNSHLIFYFYWGHRPAGISAGLKNTGNPIIARFHGTDLYEELKINNYYIPFQKLTLTSITQAIFISHHGAEYIRQKYKEVKTPLKIFRLGTINQGRSYPWEPSDNLRIISCSIVDENKRLGIIARALEHSDLPVSWTHIGTGPLMNELKLECQRIHKKNISVNLLGRIPNQQVHEILSTEQFDLFINVSKSEGTPFSIMEALSYSIPVFATSVGGSPEIIDSSCGKILDVNISEFELEKCFSEFYRMDPKLKSAIRLKARERWNDMCNAEVNYNKFVSFLKELQTDRA